MKRSRAFLADMLRYARHAVAFGSGFPADELEAQYMRYLAVQRALEVVGEAATHVPEPVRNQLTDVPFRKAIAMRNRIVHGYGTVDAQVVADTIANSLPELIVALEAALAGKLPDDAS